MAESKARVGGPIGEGKDDYEEVREQVRCVCIFLQGRITRFCT
jgi:hypothetical protein